MNILNSKLLGAAALAVVALGATPAQAWHYETVAREAHEVADAARHVHHQAEREYARRGRRDAIAIRALHALDNAARHLHRQVESYRDSPRHTMRDFQNLVYAFDAADRAIYRSRFSSHVMRDWRRVERAMYDLEAEYYGDDHGGGHDDHDDDHWDRDRHDRDPHHDDRFPRRRRVLD